MTLEEDFVAVDSDLEQRLEEYKELCDRMGFDFREHVEDLIDRAEGKY